MDIWRCHFYAPILSSSDEYSEFIKYVEAENEVKAWTVITGLYPSWGKRTLYKLDISRQTRHEIG